MGGRQPVAWVQLHQVGAHRNTALATGISQQPLRCRKVLAMDIQLMYHLMRMHLEVPHHKRPHPWGKGQVRGT